MIDIILTGTLYRFITAITVFVINFIESIGYGGIYLLMLMESANIPVPSEVVMPFAGSLVANGTFGFWLVVSVGALGNLSGSILAYGIGYALGRPFLLRWGHYFFITQEHLADGEVWLKRYGSSVIFLSRLLPVVRAFVSIPAGILRLPFRTFAIYTFLGCFIWSWVLTYAGMKLGENWAYLEPYFRKLQLSFLILLFIGIVWVFKSHIIGRKSQTIA